MRLSEMGAFCKPSRKKALHRAYLLGNVPNAELDALA